MQRNPMERPHEEEDVPPRPPSPLTARELQSRDVPKPAIPGATPSREHREFEDDEDEKGPKKGKARKPR